MRLLMILPICLGLAACDKVSHKQAAKILQLHDVEAPAAPVMPEQPAQVAAEPIAVSVPKMVYVYRYAFVLPGTSIAKAQQAHVALCDKLGPARCQVLSLSSEAADESIAKATLKLRVASAIGRQFGTSLEQAVSGTGGRAVSRSITAEDVSKDMSDTEARLRQRALLVERLTEVLRTRKGSVAELVEAERSVAAAQEEIDQAKGWLTELRGRIAMSTIDVDYAAAVASTEPVRGSIGDTVAASASAFAIAMGGMARVLIFAVPWLIFVGLGFWGWRRFQRSRPDAVAAYADASEQPS